MVANGVYDFIFMIKRIGLLLLPVALELGIAS